MFSWSTSAIAMPPPLSSIAKGIIWQKVQPRERTYTSHLVFQSYTFLPPPRKHAPLFLFHNMFTRVDCLINATSSSLYWNHIPLLVGSQRHRLTRLCVSYVYIFSKLSHVTYIHIRATSPRSRPKLQATKGKLKYCFCDCSFFPIDKGW